MDSLRRIGIAIVFFFFVTLFCNHVFLAFADGEGNEFMKNEEKPSLLKIIWRIFGKRFPPSSWELIQTVIHKIQMKFQPPDLDFRSNGKQKEKADNGAGERVKEAAKKSFGTSKETIEESAKMAGGAVGEAAQRTADKLRNKEGSHDEL